MQHKCFGDCTGLLHPQAFTAPGARCIGNLILHDDDSDGDDDDSDDDNIDDDDDEDD